MSVEAMEEGTSMGSRDRLRDHALVALLLLGSLLVIFRNDLLSGSDLFFKTFRDINPTIYRYPYCRFFLACWQEGLFPLWNPYSLLGAPVLANYQPAALSILHLPLVFLPFEMVSFPYLLARLVVAGWGAYLFCRRIGAGRTGATAAALSFGLTGYLVQYVNDQNIVIDLLLPYLLICGRRLVLRRRLVDAALMSGVSVLAILGGQPGAAIFTLGLGYGYALFMALRTPGSRTGSLVLIGGSSVIAVIIALPQLLPFLELIPRAWTFHQPGIGSEHVPLHGMVTMIAAGFYGPLDVARGFVPLVKIAPYTGATVMALALAAAFRPRGDADAFFAATLLVGTGILAGLPLFNLIPLLPVLDNLTFIKYAQPLIAFSAAMLAARSVDDITRGRGGKRLLASGIFIIAACMAARTALAPEFPAATPAMNGAVLMAVILTAAMMAVSISPGTRRIAGPATVALVIIELVFASAVNHPFRFQNVAREDFSAIREIISDDPMARIIASDDVLIPVQGILIPAFEFGQAEVLLIRESVELLQAAAGLDDEELRREFFKYHSMRAPVDTEPNEFSRMLGIGYRLSRLPLPGNVTIDLFIYSGGLTAPSPAHGGKKIMEINGDRRETLFAHPPARWGISSLDSNDANHAYVHPPPSDPSISFAAGIDPAVTNLPGDGVWFMVVSGDSTPALEWSRYVDPRRQPGEREWKEAGPGLAIRNDKPLYLITLPGASLDHDWAGWGDPRLAPEALPQAGEMVDGVRAYKDPASGPRIFPAEILKGVPPGTDVIGMLKEERAWAGRAIAEDLPERSQGPASDRVGIEEYELERVICSVSADGPGYLVLADAYYPGWKAYINGVEERIYKTNHGLRGVSAPAGESRVEFVYEPVSFRIGLWAALSCLFFLFLVVPVKRRFQFINSSGR
jgi:hypothetical protein